MSFPIGDFINISVPPSAEHTRRFEWLETNGFEWQPQHVLLYCQQVIVPELQNHIVGMKLCDAVDAHIAGIHAQHVDGLRRVDVRITANGVHWTEDDTPWYGPVPPDWYFKQLADELRFSTSWFGNNVKLSVHLGPMTAPYCILKSM